MDTIRTRRSKKTVWFVGGSVFVIVIVVVVALALTLGSDDEKHYKEAQTSTETDLGNVPDAFTYIEKEIVRTFKDEDVTKQEFFQELMKVRKNVVKVLDEKAESEEIKKASQKKGGCGKTDKVTAETQPEDMKEKLHEPNGSKKTQKAEFKADATNTPQFDSSSLKGSKTKSPRFF